MVDHLENLFAKRLNVEGCGGRVGRQQLPV